MNCDKCGHAVPEENDATILVSIMDCGRTMMAAPQPRHLLPVVIEGQVICEGSPSRAQYIEGQPRDTRAEYPYNSDDEALFRAAYADMQKLR
ncbi:MAG TPA: hypothetical protein VLF21_03780 [Candidatus Saccharimonadales bacterium]|nr:hypothetical protein [Candidatus Saccharimonadales bacterium]